MKWFTEYDKMLLFVNHTLSVCLSVAPKDFRKGCLVLRDRALYRA